MTSKPKSKPPVPVILSLAEVQDYTQRVQRAIELQAQKQSQL